jgi:hypothetical protein
MLQVCPCALCIHSFLLICIDINVVLQYFLESLKPFAHPMLGCDERLAKYAKVLIENIVLILTIIILICEFLSAFCK